jgi:hypothetical protein
MPHAIVLQWRASFCFLLLLGVRRGRRRIVLGSVLGRRSVGLFLVLDRFILRRPQIVHGLLQAGDGPLQTVDLPVRGIEPLLLVNAELGDGLLQEIDIALQATGPPFHGLFDGADFDAGNIVFLRWRPPC